MSQENDDWDVFAWILVILIIGGVTYGFAQIGIQVGYFVNPDNAWVALSIGGILAVVVLIVSIRVVRSIRAKSDD